MDGIINLLRRDFMDKKSDYEEKLKKIRRADWIALAGAFAFLFLLYFSLKVSGGMRVAMWIVGAAILIATGIFSLKTDEKVGAYKCSKCGTVINPGFKEIVLARHRGHSRKLKCECCGKRVFHDKYLE